MNKLATAAFATVLAISLVQVARAADKVQIPQQGTATYVTYYTSRSLASLDMGQLGAEAMMEMVEIAVREIKLKGGGACTETDSDGDKVFSTFDTGAHTLIGGTGKYQGISGTAPFTVSPLPSPGQGLGAIAVEHKVTWQLK